MPSVIDIRMKDIHVLVELSFSELKKLRSGLDLCEIKYDGEDNEQKEGASYVKEVFYPFVASTIENMEKEYGS